MPTSPLAAALVALTLLAPAPNAWAAPRVAANGTKEPPRPWPPEPSDTSLPQEGFEPSATAAPEASNGDVPALTVPSEPEPSNPAESHDRRLYSRAPDIGGDDDGSDVGGVEWRIENKRAKHTSPDLTLSFGIWPASINGGICGAIPVAPRGLIPSINDAFFIEFGLLLIGTHLWNEPFAPSQFDLLPAAGVRWDFYLSRLVTAFGTVKMGPRIHMRPLKGAVPDPVIGLGSILNFSRRAALRLELNYPQGFTMALSMPLGRNP